MMTRYADIDYRLMIRPRAYGGAPVDFSSYVESLQRNKTLNGSSVGSWSASLVFPETREGLAMQRLVRGRLRDDDWGELEITDRASGDRSAWEILVDRRGLTEVHGAGPEVGRSYRIDGRDWSKCMTDSEARFGAIFQSAARSMVEHGTELWAETETVRPPRMPGFIDVYNMDKIIKAVVRGIGKGLTVSEPLRELLQVILWGMWEDSSPDATPLLEKLKLHGFAHFGPVVGCAWQLASLASQRTITPDQLLRQLGNMAWNEVIYTMDASQNWPIIIFRPRPYAPNKWSQLPLHVLREEQVQVVNAEQSGAERLTYYRPQAAIACLQGVDLIVDTKSGRLPIIERSQLAVHGLRPGEPADNLFPPGSQSSEPVLEWYRRRIGMFRRWYYWNAEYLSGTVELAPADPRMRIGERVLIPFEWEFLAGDRRISTRVVEAYVTDIADTVSETERGRESSTTISFIRGQPPGGLPVPPVERWTRGAKRAKFVTSWANYEISQGAYIVVNGIQVPMPLDMPVQHFNALRVSELCRARVGSPTRFYMHQTDGTAEPNKTALRWVGEFISAGSHAGSHFIINDKGVLWQFLDPVKEVAYGIETYVTGAGTRVDHNAAGFHLDLTGTAGTGFTAAQFATFERLMVVLAARIPSFTDAGGVFYFLPLRERLQTPEQWADDMGVSILNLPPGMYAHQQLQANRSDPSSPAHDPTVWERLCSLVP